MTSSQLMGIRAGLTYIFSEEVALNYRLTGQTHTIQLVWYPETLGLLARFLRTGMEVDYNAFITDCQSY